MRSWKKIVALACLAAAAAVLFLRSTPAPKPAEPRSAQTGLRVHWPEGRRLTFALSWTAKTTGEMAPGVDGKGSQIIALESAVDGEIAMERVAGTPGHAQVALSYSRFDKFSFGMQGQEAKGDLSQLSAALAGQPAFLDVDDRGRITSIAFPAAMQAATRSVLRGLALQLRYTLPATATGEWEAAEQDSLGEVRVRYREGEGEMAREPLAYRTLDAVEGTLVGRQALIGGAVIRLDAAGLPLSIEEIVDASYTRPGGAAPAVRSVWRFTLRRTGESAGTPSLLGVARGAQSQPVRAQVADPDREKRHDQRMAEGMSLDSIFVAFGRFETGERPGHQFLVRAAAWLRLHPENLPLMVARFRSHDLTVRGRGLILDVLTEAGTPAAQKAMRDALSSGEAREQPKDFGALVQRFTFVRDPEPESIAFLERVYDEEKRAGGRGAQGAAVALGSSVRRLHDREHDALARDVNERLRADLRTAGTPELRGALVAALGNAGREEDVPDLIAVAADPDVRVRAARAGGRQELGGGEQRFRFAAQPEPRGRRLARSLADGAGRAHAVGVGHCAGGAGEGEGRVAPGGTRDSRCAPQAQSEPGQ